MQMSNCKGPTGTKSRNAFAKNYKEMMCIRPNMFAQIEDGCLI